MKKLTLLCTIVLAVFLAKAQPSNSATDNGKAEFNTFSQAAEKEAHADYEKKDYAASVTVSKGWFARYEALSPELKKNFQGYRAGFYYNLACYEAMAGQKTDAIVDFGKAVDTGYGDYANTLLDSDLVTLHEDTQFKADLQRMRELHDMGYRLQQSGPYNKEAAPQLKFTYQSASAPELVNLRKKFNLDSVAGNGDEISKFKNLLYWAHNSVRHDGNSSNPLSRNAIDLIEVCKRENRGVNCRMMATILRDAYQAEGFNTRIVTCMPKDTLDNDCHVITVVWSKTLNKWVWMDPTFNAYVSDDKGNLLNIQEVRERLINGSPLVLNDDANWNNKTKETKAEYLGYYMSKNLYWLKCSTKSEWDIETTTPGKAQKVEYVNLYPGGFTTLHQSGGIVHGMQQYATNNADYFWQKPDGE